MLEALGVDYIDESEVLTPADENNHIDKHAFKVPFVRGCRNLGEAPRRINEGAAMMDQGRGRHRQHRRGGLATARRQQRDIRRHPERARGRRLFVAAKEPVPLTSYRDVAENGKLPVVNFSLPAASRRRPTRRS